MRRASWLLLALPVAAGARPPVLVDFTEGHSVAESRLSQEEARAILEQIPGRKRLSLDECGDAAGRPDPVPLVTLVQAVEGDFLRDGLGPQLLAVVQVTPCERRPRPIDVRTRLALVRAGKVVAQSGGLRGAARVERVARPAGGAGDLAILVFPWQNLDVLGAGAEVWGAGPGGLSRVKDLGPVRRDTCGEAKGGNLRAAVFFVKRPSPLELLEKVYQAPCGGGARPRWALAGDGPLKP